MREIDHADFQQTSTDRTIVSSAMFGGAILGILVFGFLIDKLGRKYISIATLVITIVGSILAATSFRMGALSVYHMLAIGRFITGKSESL
jgi:MFS family permease